MKKTLLQGSTIVLISILFCCGTKADDLLPRGFSFPEAPKAGDSRFVNYKDERPSQDINGRAYIRMNLAPSLPISTGLLDAAPGEHLSFFPAEKIELLPPGSEKGSKDNLIVAFGDTKILFGPEMPDGKGLEFKSVNFPGYRIKRAGEKLAMLDFHSKKEYLFGSPDGWKWRLEELRYSFNKKRFIKFEYDRDGQLKAAALPGGEKYEIEYNRTGLPAKLKDPDGAETVFQWDERARIKGLKTFLPKEHPLYPRGATVGLAMRPYLVRSIKCECDSAEGRLTSLLNSNSEKFVIEYRTDKDLKKKTDFFCGILTLPDKTKEYAKAIWSSKGIKAEKGTLEISKKGDEKFRCNQETLYEKKNGIFTEKPQNGSSIIQKNQDGGTTTTHTDALDRTSSISTDADGHITDVTSACGSGLTMSYDDLGRLVGKNESGVRTKYKYDEGGLLLEVERGEAVTRYEYDSDGMPIKTILPDGTVHEFTWDKQFRLRSHKFPNGALERFEYAGYLPLLTRHEKISIDGTDSKSNLYTYTPAGYLASSKHLYLGSEQFEYQGADIVKMTDSKGQVTKYAYDSMHRKLKEIGPNGMTTFKYDEQGRLVQTSPPDGKISRNEYDEKGWLKKKINPDKSWVEYEYNVLGRVTKEIYSDGTWTEYQYDQRDRKIAILGTHQPNWKCTYDSAGRMVLETKTDEKGQEQLTRNEYDENGRLKKTVLPDGKEIIYQYEGSLTRLHAMLRDGMITRHWYDEKGLMTGLSICPFEVYKEAKTPEERKKLLQDSMAFKNEYDKFGDAVRMIPVDKKQLAQKEPLNDPEPKGEAQP